MMLTSKKWSIQIMIFKIQEPVYFIGDLHCNFQWLKPAIEKFDLHDCSLVFCGDLGLGVMTRQSWFNWMKQLKLDKCLSHRNVTCYFVRGNHDNPSWYDNKTLMLKHFKAIKDYSVLSTSDHNILCVGGGISIDRYDRKLENKLALFRYQKYHPLATPEEIADKVSLRYWETENPVFDQKQLDKLTVQIDTVCSHVAPTVFPPSPGCPKKWVEQDPELRLDCLMERNVMDTIWTTLKELDHPLKYWFYGHYHRYATAVEYGVIGCALDMARDGVLCVKELR